MPIFRGNVGNLLQHWVFCEILDVFRNYSELSFVDAYSMSPMADERPKRDLTAHLFDHVHTRLPGERTAYEQAWHRLAPQSGKYPNSASFLADIWAAHYSMLLCESDPATVRQLVTWAHTAAREENCFGAEVFAGDWRDRFRQGLTVSGELVLISFDPYMFDCHGSGRNPGNMVPSDLDQLAETVKYIDGAVLVQLSTFSANNNNPQRRVRELVMSHLSPWDFELLAGVRADGNMMSLVLGRHVEIPARINELAGKFEAWLNRAKGGCK